MQTELQRSIHAFEPTSWDALNPGRYPGLLHGFLSSLEDSKSVGEGTGWLPLYASVGEQDELIGSMVCYMKTDSYGEYVFDWAWADAYHRNGLNYYPKCITAIPFTPASGPRILIKNGYNRGEVTRHLIEALKEKLAGKVSSWHILFPDEDSYESLKMADSWLERDKGNGGVAGRGSAGAFGAPAGPLRPEFQARTFSAPRFIIRGSLPTGHTLVAGFGALLLNSLRALSAEPFCPRCTGRLSCFVGCLSARWGKEARWVGRFVPVMPLLFRLLAPRRVFYVLAADSGSVFLRFDTYIRNMYGFIS